MGTLQVFKDPCSGLITKTIGLIDPKTEPQERTTIIIREMALYGEAMPRLLLKKPRSNFHAGTRNGVPTKRRK